MTYKPRVEVPGLYHVTARGNNKRSIAVDDLDRRMFAVVLNRVATRHGWVLLAVCLMDNHYHLIMRIGERGMSKGMCELNTAYALAFNVRHGRVNHLFGRRYWSDQLDGDPADAERRFFAAVRYVFRNPVKAGVVRRPQMYGWSSYPAAIGVALTPFRVATDELLTLVANNRPEAIKQLRELCEISGDGSGHARWQPP